MDNNHFCMGEGMVMQRGFQVGYGSDRMCMLFLFKGWVLNTKGKYAAAVLGSLVLAVVASLAITWRKKIAPRLIGSAWGRLVAALLVGAQLTLGYFLMLLVMMYETWIFTAIIVGFTLGAWLSTGPEDRRLEDPSSDSASEEYAAMKPSTPRQKLVDVDSFSGPSPCCDTGVTAS